MSPTGGPFLSSSALVLEKQQHRQRRSRSRSTGDTGSPTGGVLEVPDSHQSAPVLKVQHLPGEGRPLRCLYKKRTPTISRTGMAALDGTKWVTYSDALLCTY